MVTKIIHIILACYFLYFLDLLLFEGDQILNGNFAFKNLVAQNIYVKRINNIPFEKMCTGNGQKVVGKKTLQNISVENISATYMNEVRKYFLMCVYFMLICVLQRTTEDVLHYLQNNVHYNFYNLQSLNMKNFNFDIINGIYWRDFSYSLFNTKGNSEINGKYFNIILCLININFSGTVIIHSNVKINNLITKKLSNIKVDQIMTTSTAQNISSDMQLMNVHVENIITNDINGLSFKKHVATYYDNNFVTGIFFTLFSAQN